MRASAAEVLSALRGELTGQEAAEVQAACGLRTQEP
jgi:hypothetical protein